LRFDDLKAFSFAFSAACEIRIKNVIFPVQKLTFLKQFVTIDSKDKISDFKTLIEKQEEKNV
jgi:hypothetical protein